MVSRVGRDFSAVNNSKSSRATARIVLSESRRARSFQSRAGVPALACLSRQAGRPLRAWLTIIRPPTPCFCRKSLQAAENKGYECEKERQEKTIGGKLLKTKEQWRVTSGEGLERHVDPTPPWRREVCASCSERERYWRHVVQMTGGVACDAKTHWVAEERREVTGTLSAEPWSRDYRIRYCLSSEKLRAVN